jgi:hypothetical protein
MRSSHSQQSLEDDEGQSPQDDEIVAAELDINRKISVYKHVKKKAANDAQLLM